MLFYGLLYRGVAQFGQSAAFGTQRSQVQILSPRLKLLLKRVRIREGEVFWIYVYYFLHNSAKTKILTEGKEII